MPPVARTGSRGPRRRARPRLAARTRSASIAGLALAWLLVGNTAAAAEPTGPVGRDPAGLIAFVNDAGQVAVVNPSTAEITAFGGGQRRAIFPAWSSDGTRIAAVVAVPGASRVEVVDVGRGGDPVTVLSAPDRAPIYLSWSPDDRFIAVLSNTPSGRLALDVVDVTRAFTGDPEASTTLELGQPFYWVWSPTGRSLLVHRDILQSSAIVGLTPIDAFEVADPLPTPGAFQAPDISDSGRFVAYSRRDELGDRVVVAANPERGGPGDAVAELAHDGLVAFAWRPGREQLSVQGATAPGYFTGPVELLDVATGEARVISGDVVIGSFWSRDGRWLATLSVEEGGSDRPVMDGPGRLLRVQERSPLLTLRFVDVDDLSVVDAGAVGLTPAFLLQYLPFFDQYSRSHSLWSPDGSAMVLPVVTPDGVETLMVFGVDGTRRELVPGDMPAWNVR